MRSVHSPQDRPKNKSKSAQLQSVPINAASSPLPDEKANSESEASLNQHKPTKKSRNRVPPPQRERIFQKFVAGKNVAEISREENRNRETVARIVRSDEMREHVNRMREALYGLTDSALGALRHALEKEMDGQLAYKILVDTGVVPSAAERAQVQMVPESKDDPRVIARIIARIIRSGVGRERAFGMDTDTDEILAKDGIRVDEAGNLVPIEPKKD